MTTSENRSRQMHLAVFLTACGNYHTLGWRHPDAWVDGGSNFDRWIEFARIAEAGKLDMLFIADQMAIVGGDELHAIENSSKINRFEPMTLLSALVRHTSRIGLAGTCATSYSEPYDVARMFASLDHLSMSYRSTKPAAWPRPSSSNRDDLTSGLTQLHQWSIHPTGQ